MEVEVSRYTVRVELHRAGSDDYDLLHEFMEAEGFLRYIVDDDDARHQLPTAEYNISSNGGRVSILKRAKQAALQTGKQYMVFVTESNGRTWWNLPPWRG